MDLSILIVNWNAARYLRHCLASIFEHVRGFSFEVVVVDNASYDGSAELISCEFPQVKFVQSNKNLGFARGNNFAFRHCRGECVFLLNPDTELLDDSVAAMLDHLRHDQTAGAVGCRLLNSDGTLQWKYVQAFPTIWNQILGADLLQRVFPRWRIWGLRPLFDYGSKPLDVDVLAGSCMMLKRSVFEDVGLFDEQYYMYGDDVDLCYRIRQAGFAIRYIGAKRIIHHGGTSSSFRRESGFASVMQKESRWKFFAKTHGRTYANLYRIAIAVTALSRLFLICCMTPVASIWMERQRLGAGFRKWWIVLRWAAGREDWAATVGR